MGHMRIELRQGETTSVSVAEMPPPGTLLDVIAEASVATRARDDATWSPVRLAHDPDRLLRPRVMALLIAGRSESQSLMLEQALPGWGARIVDGHLVVDMAALGVEASTVYVLEWACRST